MAYCLESEGYRVSIVEDGVAALASITESPPDLVLLDLILPRMSGFLVLETMREDARMRGIPVVVVSARSDDRDVERARLLGAQEYLMKPFLPQDLLTVVRRTLPKEA
ncbi:MAG: response regulator [Chloroflexota bacterium]